VLFCGIHQQSIPVKEPVSALMQTRYKRYNRTILQSVRTEVHNSWSVIRLVLRWFRKKRSPTSLELSKRFIMTCIILTAVFCLFLILNISGWIADTASSIKYKVRKSVNNYIKTLVESTPKSPYSVYSRRYMCIILVRSKFYFPAGQLLFSHGPRIVFPFDLKPRNPLLALFVKRVSSFYYL
jgi:hypothetical protein